MIEDFFTFFYDSAFASEHISQSKIENLSEPYSICCMCHLHSSLIPNLGELQQEEQQLRLVASAEHNVWL